MKKVGDVTKWRQLPADMAIGLRKEEPRQVRLELNTETATRVHLVTEDGPVFLGTLDGLDEFWFTVPGPVDVLCESEGEVWYHTVDGQTDELDLPAEVSFTVIAQRSSRNPELERIMFKQEQNMMRRLAIQQAEFQAAMERRGWPHNPETGELDEDVPAASEQHSATAGGDGGENPPKPSEPPAPEPEAEGVQAGAAKK